MAAVARRLCERAQMQRFRVQIDRELKGCDRNGSHWRVHKFQQLGPSLMQAAAARPWMIVSAADGVMFALAAAQLTRVRVILSSAQ